ncbi:KH domain-containing protein [Bacillus thermotolerans]|uniref:RNA-binding protein KhpA n=1 Tax=Bacillus thermotolerans TaxID=1221996 RepID=A0A0F5IA58_BACTR|nr:KH domain-containing protein [Bacillus thermotolerans]KKB39316.1 KH domain RNA binding protein YlqC [Bacillus thermotolerans]KKB42333.1 KH domain RNA binding protein YlqC [Bacillus thermotolerans]KKB44642.1 KH domain RNA binding protein YlqC [Bacillus thermotolerans]
MEELILAIVSPLIDHPEEMTIEKREEEHKDIYRLFLHSDDIGKVIGKQGRVAKAIRTIVTAANADHSKKVYVEIAE